MTQYTGDCKLSKEKLKKAPVIHHRRGSPELDLDTGSLNDEYGYPVDVSEVSVFAVDFADFAPNSATESATNSATEFSTTNLTTATATATATATVTATVPATVPATATSSVPTTASAMVLGMAAGSTTATAPTALVSGASHSNHVPSSNSGTEKLTSLSRPPNHAVSPLLAHTGVLHTNGRFTLVSSTLGNDNPGTPDGTLNGAPNKHNTPITSPSPPQENITRPRPRLAIPPNFHSVTEETSAHDLDNNQSTTPNESPKSSLPNRNPTPPKPTPKSCRSTPSLTPSASISNRSFSTSSSPLSPPQVPPSTPVSGTSFVCITSARIEAEAKVHEELVTLMQGLESFIELPQIAPPSTSPPIPHGPLSTPARTLSSDMEATLATPPTNRLALNPLDRIEDELHVHFDEGLAYAVTKSLLGLRQPTQSRRPPQKLRHSLAAISNFVPEAWRRSVEVVEKVKKENKEKTKATTAGINVRHEYGRATAPVAEQQSHESTNVDMGTDAEFTESLESEWETMSEDTEHGEELDQLSGEAIARNVQQHNANLPAEFYRLSPFNTRSYPDTPKPAPHNTQLTPDSSTMAWANHRTPTSAQPSHSHPFGSNTNNWPNAYSHGTGAWAKDPLPDTPTPTRKHSTIREVPRPTAPTPNSVPPSNTNTDNTPNPNQASTSNPSPTICRRITGEYDPVTGPRIRTQILHFRLPDGIPDGMLVNGRAIHIYDQASINDYFSQINGNSGTVGGQFAAPPHTVSSGQSAGVRTASSGQSTAQSHTTNGGEPAPAAATPAHSILRSLLSPPATQTYPTRRTSRRLPTRLPNPFRPAHGEFGLGRVQQQQDRQRGREQGEDEHQDGQKGKRMPKHKWYDSRRWRN